MERLQKTKRKHLQINSSSDERDSHRGKGKHSCCHPEPVRAGPPSNHYQAVQCHHALAREKRRKSKSRRTKRREKRRQSQARHEEKDKHYVEEKSEFRRHVRKAHEISSKSTAGNQGIASNPVAVITQNRLTRGLGIYNKGKRSSKVVRDAIVVPESVEMQVNEDLRKIIAGCKTADNPPSSDVLLEEISVHPSTSGSHHSHAERLTELLASTHLHRTPLSSHSMVPGDVTALNRSHDQSHDQSHGSPSSSGISGIHEFPPSPPLEELSAQLAESLNLERYFPGQDYLTIVINDLKKLVNMPSPAVLEKGKTRTPRNMSHHRTSRTICRRLEDSFGKKISSDEGTNESEVHHHISKGHCLQETPTVTSCLPTGTQAGVSYIQVGQDSAGNGQQSSLHKFKEYIRSQSTQRHCQPSETHLPAQCSKVDVTVQTCVSSSKRALQSTQTQKVPTQAHRSKSSNSWEEHKYEHANVCDSKCHTSSSTGVVPRGEQCQRRRYLNGPWEACPSPWIQCCADRRHLPSSVLSLDSRDPLSTREQAQIDCPSGRGRMEHYPIRAENDAGQIGNDSRPEQLTIDIGVQGGQVSGQTHSDYSRSCDKVVRSRDASVMADPDDSMYLVPVTGSTTEHQESGYRLRAEGKEIFEQEASRDAFDDDMMDGLQFLKKAEELDRIWSASRSAHDSQESGPEIVGSHHLQPWSKSGHWEGNLEEELQYREKYQTIKSLEMGNYPGTSEMDCSEKQLGASSLDVTLSNRYTTARTRMALSPLADYQLRPTKKRTKRQPYTWMTITDSSETDEEGDPYWSSDLPLPPPPVLLLPDTPKLYPQKMF